MDIPDLYRALEFSHYAERYRDHVLATGLSLNTPFHDLGGTVSKGNSLVHVITDRHVKGR